jgi:hypothetical protein
MKLVVYFSQTQGFDGRIFVVRTVNKLPQAKCLLVLDQSLDLASVDQELHAVITRQVPAQTPCSSCKFEKVGMGEA